MAATEHAFNEPPPSRLYLDTDVVIAYLVSTEPHHARCRAFLDRLAHAGHTQLFVSSISWLEFAHVVSRERFRTALPSDLQARFRLDRWAQPLVRQRYLQAHLGYFESVLAQFAWAEVSLTPQVRAAAAQYIGRFNLGAHDAIHLASAMQVGVTDLASLDRGYRRVDGIELWNDLLYVGQPA